jgi:hypothetical protein
MGLKTTAFVALLASSYPLAVQGCHSNASASVQDICSACCAHDPTQCGNMETACVAAGNKVQQEAVQAGCASQFNDILNCFSQNEEQACSSTTCGGGPGLPMCMSPCQAQLNALTTCTNAPVPAAGSISSSSSSG